MPTYVFRCSCGETVEQFLRVSEKDANTPQHCGKPMETVLQPSYSYVQSECHYKCPVTGKGVTSWRQRKNIFAEHGLVDGSDWNPQKEFEKAQKAKAKAVNLGCDLPPEIAAEAQKIVAEYK